MKKAYLNGTIYTGSEILNNHAVLTDGKKITGIVSENEIPSGFFETDLKEHNLTPSFLDLQIYGAGQYLFSNDPSSEALDAINMFCMKGGCSGFLITMASNSFDVTERFISAAKKLISNQHSGMLGLHIEGPWINPEKRGAHPEAYIYSPTLDDAKKLIDMSDGIIRMITLAPEVTDDSVIDYLTDNNIILSAGHSNATYQQATKAFHKIKTATHLFNGMSGFRGREPGLVGALLDHPEATCSIIADGIHVDYASIRICKKIMGERLFLITDAVAASGSGTYQHHFNADHYVMPDGTLSGSALNMMQAVKNCVTKAGIPLDEALRMASLYPARVLGLQHQYGKIAPGFKASFTIFNRELNCIEMILP